MNSVVSSPDSYAAMSDLRARLQEAEDTLAAIRSGSVDAIVVDGPDGEKVFSLAGADRPYRLMIERMNQGAAMLREDGTIIFCNAAMASMLGSKPESVTGSNIHAYACLDMQETLNSVLEQGGKGNARRELHFRRIGGAEVPALVAVSSLGRENAATLCLLATDLSEQKRRQEELETSHRQVSAYAAELQRSNQELGEFATVAGHDLQQPARKVCSLAGQLKAEWGDRLGDEGRRVVQHLAGSAERMHQLIDALLSYARIQTQNKALATVNLQEVLRSVLADLEVDIREAGARVQLGWLPEIVGDETQLRQLFQNLISNALKYRRRDVVPEITVEARLCPVNVLEVLVRDNGTGFDMQHADAIFRPFQRLVSEAECPGAGMGLAICRKIAARHGGTISAHSQTGTGSTFVIRLPGDTHCQQKREGMAAEHVCQDRNHPTHNAPR